MHRQIVETRSTYCTRLDVGSLTPILQLSHTLTHPLWLFANRQWQIAVVHCHRRNVRVRVPERSLPAIQWVERQFRYHVCLCPVRKLLNKTSWFFTYNTVGAGLMSSNRPDVRGRMTNFYRRSSNCQPHHAVHISVASTTVLTTTTMHTALGTTVPNAQSQTHHTSSGGKSQHTHLSTVIVHINRPIDSAHFAQPMSHNSTYTSLSLAHDCALRAK
jgi:hypothetical protein